MSPTRQFFEWLQQVSPQNLRPRILIFTETKKAADALCRELRYEQFEAGAIHGNKDQAERDAILNNFRKGKCQILVATDVAQRGLDIKDVEYATGWWFQTIFAVPRYRQVNYSPQRMCFARPYNYSSPDFGFRSRVIRWMRQTQQ